MKIKRLILILLSFLLLLQPAALSAKTAYTNKKCHIYSQPSTSAARKTIPINTKLTYIAAKGKFYYVKVGNYKQKVFILKKYVSKKKTKIVSKTSSKVEKLTWEKGKNVLKNNETASLYSIEKNIELNIKRLGGLNHMDVEPLTSEDTNKLLSIANGSFSWASHPMILKIDGKEIACSINTMPHGAQSISDNNYNGQFCLHLVGSKTHGTNKINEEHQKQIECAYNWRS